MGPTMIPLPAASPTATPRLRTEGAALRQVAGGGMVEPICAGGASVVTLPASRADGARVLVVAEGSGGHLIPALEVSRALTSAGASVMVVYVTRPQVASLLDGLTHTLDATQLSLRPFSLFPCPLPAARSVWRLGQASLLWRLSRAWLKRFRPQVVVGFGGWLSVPVILAARQQRIPILLHEQNVQLGRANRFLLRWADRMALSFPACAEENGAVGEAHRTGRNGTPSLITGLPLRPSIGTASREAAARQLRLSPCAPTVCVLGGSQGSRALNQLVCELLIELSFEERQTWQFLHLTGTADVQVVQQAYAAFQMHAVVAPHLMEMASAYALADVVVARAGASTVAELAQCGKPAILIPYPHASGHQRANARVVESASAGILLEEHDATPQRLHGILRQLLTDDRLRQMMGVQMHTLAQPAATQRLTQAILTLAHRAPTPPRMSDRPRW